MIHNITELAAQVLLREAQCRTETDWIRKMVDRLAEAEGSSWEALRGYRKSVPGHTLKMKLALSNPAQTWSTEQLARSILSGFRLKKHRSRSSVNYPLRRCQGFWRRSISSAR